MDCQLLFSLIIGVTADKIGFNPLFIAMGFLILLVLFFWLLLLQNVAKTHLREYVEMKTLKTGNYKNQSAHHIELLVDGQHSLCLYILEENMFRVLLKRKGFCRWTEPRALLRKRMSRGKGVIAKILAVFHCRPEHGAE